MGKDKNQMRISKLNIVDAYKLIKWDKTFDKENADYKNITEFISYNGIKGHLKGFNDVRVGIGVIKSKHFYVLKDNKGKIKSFISLQKVIDKGDETLYIQSIASCPSQNRKGYATHLLSSILKNAKKYVLFTPKKITALVDIRNDKMFIFLGRFAVMKPRIISDGFTDFWHITMNYQEMIESIDNQDFSQKGDVLNYYGRLYYGREIPDYLQDEINQ